MTCFRLALAVLTAPYVLSICGFAAAGPPNFSGTWELDAAKSPDAQGRTVTYRIQDASGKINLTRVVHEKDGKETTSQFTCETGGGQCDFDEGGRKAHVSLWYNGQALVILKTDGPKEDATTQWTLQLDSDGKTMNIKLEHIEPTDKDEKLIFDKKI